MSLLFLENDDTDPGGYILAQQGIWPVLTLEAAFADDATVASPTWSDLSTRILDFTVNRGRSMELDETETGVCTHILRNQDRQLDPTNTAGSYYPNVVPVRQARFRALIFPSTVWENTYDVFRGDIPDWPQDWQGRINTVPVQIVDAFDALQVAYFTTSRPVELSGARVSAILDAIGWPSALRAIDTGHRTVQATDYVNANALSELQSIATSEGGVLFMSRAGNIVFHDVDRRLLDTTLTATFSNQPSGAEMPLSDAKIVYRRERMRNRVAVEQSGSGFTVVASDSTSQTRYRVRDLPVTTVSLSNTADVQAMAEYLLLSYKDPMVRVEEITIEPQQDGRLWPQALGRDIGDRIRVKIVPPGSPTSTITSDVVIEGVSHVANGASQRWQTTFRCSPANTNTYLVLDDATKGVMDSTYLLGP